MPQNNKSKNSILSVITFLFAVMLILGVGEVMVRVLVPNEIYFPISNIFTPVDSKVGYTYRPNFNGTAFGVDLKTNSLGFRGPEWGIKKDNSTFRIALIGDSHAFGYGVSFEDTVGEKLKKYLEKKTSRKIEVLNFGVNGHNARQQKAVFMEYALQYNPSLTLVLPCNNDHEEALTVDNQGYLQNKNQIQIEDRSVKKLTSNAISAIVPYSRLAFYLVFLKKKFDFSQTDIPQTKTLKIAQDTENWWMGSFEPGLTPDQLRESVYRPLQSIIHESKKRKIPIVIANFNAMLGYRKLYQNLAQEEHIPSIELLTLFPEANSWQELLKLFGLGWNDHLGSAAHERWAKEIGKVIINSNYID